MMTRMKKALSEPIEFEIKECQVDSDNFDVCGSTGNSYIVSIKRQSKSQCSCMDFQNRGKICKHIIAILMKHYMLNIHQIIEFGKNPDLGLDDVPSRSSSGGDTNEDCPICFQKLQHIEWLCEQCGKTFHYSCISDWFSILQRQRMEPSCPMCRHTF